MPLQRLGQRLAALVLCAAAAPVLAQGSVLAIGGALADDNHAVWSRLVQLAGGRGACVSVFATASSAPDASAAAIAANLARHGARGQHIRIAPRLPGMDAAALAAAVRDAAWQARVRGCRGVFFSGGAQERLLDTLAPGGVDSPLLQAVREVWQRGGVVAGTSSGAAVLSAIAFRDAPDALAVMKGRLRAGQEWAPGFGFTPVLIDQHFMRRGRIARLLPLMRAQDLALGLGVEENSAALIRGTQVEVLGAAGVLVADLTETTSEPRLPAFNLRGARLHWLQGGDRYDLATRRPQPAGRRLPAAAGSAVPEGTEVRPDMLGPGVLLRGLQGLLESDGGTLRALSFAVQPAADDAAPDLGFEWRLRADAETSAWRTASGITLLDARLDIVPVRMQLPLYRPLAAAAGP